MRTDDGRIDHLQRGVRHSASREPFQDHVPDATVGPPPKLPKDRIPVAEALRQVAPWCAGSHQPKHRVEHAAMIAWRPAAAAMDQERFEVRPLIVGHQSANQGCPPQRAALNQFAILASIGLSTRPRLTDQYLAGADFGNTKYFASADLRGANLSAAYFGWANLDYARFDGAKMADDETFNDYALSEYKNLQKFEDERMSNKWRYEKYGYIANFEHSSLRGATSLCGRRRDVIRFPDRSEISRGPAPTAHIFGWILEKS